MLLFVSLLPDNPLLWTRVTSSLRSLVLMWPLFKRVARTSTRIIFTMKTVILIKILLSTVISAVPIVTSSAFYARLNSVQDKIYFIDDFPTTEKAANPEVIVPWKLSSRCNFCFQEAVMCLKRCRKGQQCIHGECRTLVNDFGKLKRQGVISLNRRRVIIDKNKNI